MCGFAWNQHADLVAVYTDYGITTGMEAGINFAVDHNIPVVFRSFKKKPTVIGLVGRAGSGKDSMAECIKGSADGTMLVSVAGPIKETASVLFNVDIEYFHDREKKEEVLTQWGMSPRQMCQKLGTEMIRKELGDNFLPMRMSASVRSELEKPDTRLVIVTDVRFEDEAALLRREYDAVLIHIDADERIGCIPEDVHASERSIGIIAKWDEVVTLKNNGDIDQFKRDVFEFSRSALM